MSIQLSNLHWSFSTEVVDPDHVISAASSHEHSTYKQQRVCFKHFLWFQVNLVLKDKSSLQESTGNHITLYSPLLPCTKQNLHRLKWSFLNCCSEQNKCSNTKNGPTATERWCGHLNSWAWPFNKLHWLITGEAKWRLLLWKDIYLGS